MPIVERVINDYYFEFDEQDYTTILVVAYVTSRKPDADPKATAEEKDRVQVLDTMFHNLSRLPRYVVYFGNPAPVKAQGSDYVAMAIRGAISRKDRSRPTFDEISSLIADNLEPPMKKVKGDRKRTEKT
jgi:hypothetical protein